MNRPRLLIALLLVVASAPTAVAQAKRAEATPARAEAVAVATTRKSQSGGASKAPASSTTAKTPGNAAKGGNGTPTKAAGKGTAPKAAANGGVVKAASNGATGKGSAAKAPSSGAAAKAAGGAAAGSGAGAKAPAAGTNKLGAKTKAKQPCLARPVQLVRVRGQQVEPYELSLTRCNGMPNRAALDTLSILARPRDVERPTPAEIRAYRARPVAKGKVSAKSKKKYRDPLFVSEQVMRLHPDLLLRLQRIANRYRGKIIEIVSGYRPDARDTSRHHHGRALDLRVVGVPRERLRDFARSFEETGVGYYPNSYFVHVDVRDTKAYWVDRSGPGEPADYGPWPPTKRDVEQARDQVLKHALADLSALGVPAGQGAERRSATAQGAKREPTEAGDEMTPAEVARARKDARRAVDQL